MYVYISSRPDENKRILVITVVTTVGHAKKGYNMVEGCETSKHETREQTHSSTSTNRVF